MISLGLYDTIRLDSDFQKNQTSTMSNRREVHDWGYFYHKSKSKQTGSPSIKSNLQNSKCFNVCVVYFCCRHYHGKNKRPVYLSSLSYKTSQEKKWLRETPSLFRKGSRRRVVLTSSTYLNGTNLVSTT